MTETEWIKLLNNGDTRLENIPEAERNAAVCLATVQSYDYALTYVPRKLRTPEMFLAAGMILCGANNTNTKEDGKFVLMYRFLCEKDNRKLKVAIYAKSISEALINLAYGGYTVLKSLGAATL